MQNKSCFTDAVVEAAQLSFGPESLNPVLQKKGESLVKQKTSLKNILKRPGISINDFRDDLLCEDFPVPPLFSPLIEEALFEAETIIKYEGYIKRQKEQIKKLSSINNKKIPCGFDYKRAVGLSSEAVEKLSLIKPETLGQAMRISGINPSDISVLSVCLYK